MPLPRVLYQSVKNTSPNGCQGCNVGTFFIWDYFTSFFAFLWLHRCIVCNDCNAVYSLLMLFLWSVIECYQYSLWHYINLNLRRVWKGIRRWAGPELFANLHAVAIVSGRVTREFRRDHAHEPHRHVVVLPASFDWLVVYIDGHP